MRRNLPRLLPLLLLLLLLPATVMASSKKKDAVKLSQLAVTPESVTDASDPSAVHWEKVEKTIYLFLPAGYDSSALRIWFNGPSHITVNDTKVHPGDVVSFFKPGKSVTVTYGKESTTIVVMQSKNIASIHLTTESGSLDAIHKSKQNRESGQAVIINADGTEETRQNMTAIRCRGNSSFGYEKKSYQITLEEKANLYGMGKSRTWVLTANYRDLTLLRNKICYDMAAYVGLSYTPECVFADLYINGKYLGNYLLCEKVQIGTDRVEIDNLEKATEQLNDQALSTYEMSGEKLKNGTGKYYAIPNNPEDITGGYLFCMEYAERYDSMKSAVTTDRGVVFELRSPSYLSKKQYTYISGIIQSFENAIFAKDGVDKTTKKRYTSIADMDSLVLKFILEELTGNYDANYASQYFYKPADSESTLFYAGPAWDYDNTFDLSHLRTSKYEFPTGEEFYMAEQKGDYWWPALYSHATFRNAVHRAWKKKYLPALDILLGRKEDPTGRLQAITDYMAQIRASAAMNAARWPNIKNGSSGAGKHITHGKNWEANCNYLIKYVGIRRNWLNKQWNK